nr:MAG TPA_asm: hypothetical protein [Caudoviricetes sp.]
MYFNRHSVYYLYNCLLINTVFIIDKYQEICYN